MPTYAYTTQFLREFDKLTVREQALFLVAVRKLVANLRVGRLRAGLRVKPVQGQPGRWEMTWTPDGRAIFIYGPKQMRGQRHVIWERIGGHEIFE